MTPSAVAAASTAAAAVPEVDEGWIRVVLFEHALDDWIDLGPDPLRRKFVGDAYAQQVAAAYSAWKWCSDRAGVDVNDAPPAEVVPAGPLAAAVAAADWTELMAVLLTVARAQALLFADLVAAGDEVARRTFDRPARDCAGQAALGYLELRRATFVDGPRAKEHLDRLVPLTERWLQAVDAARGPGVSPGAPRWRAHVQPLLDSLA